MIERLLKKKKLHLKMRKERVPYLAIYVWLQSHDDIVIV